MARCLLSAAPDRSGAQQEHRPGGPRPTSTSAAESDIVIRPYRGRRRGRPAESYPSRAGSRGRPVPSMNVATTLAWWIAPGAPVEQVAIQDGEVGGLADLDRAGVRVEVVDVGRADGERGQGVHEIDPLVRQEDRVLAAVGVADAVDRHLHLEQGIGGRDAPVRAHGEGRAGGTAASGTGTATSTAPGRGTGSSGAPSGPRRRPSSGCAFATTPSSRNRPMSSGWMTWMWAMCGRVSERPVGPAGGLHRVERLRGPRGRRWRGSAAGSRARRGSATCPRAPRGRWLNPRLAVGRPSASRYGSRRPP